MVPWVGWGVPGVYAERLNPEPPTGRGTKGDNDSELDHDPPAAEPDSGPRNYRPSCHIS